jgi:hypothetical protein
MKKFTVILLYPDYITNSGMVCETYIGHILSTSKEFAAEKVQAHLAHVNDADEPEDFKVLHVFAGHLEDLS